MMGILNRDERGASAVEYGFLAAFIAGVVVIVVASLGGLTNEMFGDTCAEVHDGVVSAGRPPSANC